MTDDKSTTITTKNETNNPSSAEVIAAQNAPEIVARNPPEAEGFVTINPALPVYRPLENNHRLRGFPLSRQMMADGTSYYVMQISEALNYCIRGEAYVDVKPGELVLVAEHSSLAGMPHLLPIFRQQGQEQIAERGFEVIFEPFRKYDGESWSFLLKARHLIGERAKMIQRPPSFALPDLPTPD